MQDFNIAVEAEKTLYRILPRVEARFADYRKANLTDWTTFKKRLEFHFERLFGILLRLYGSQYDFFFHLEELIILLAQSWIERGSDLKLLDEKREKDTDWYQSNQMLGGVCYVDLFAGNLKGVEQKIPYFQELGLSCLHLMPLFRCPEGENDGGYAISSYREVDTALGTMNELTQLAVQLREVGISLVLDFVFNHTSNEHEWALKARSGNEEYQAFYYMYDNRTMPDAYERTLREIFPDEHPGAFTFFPDIGKWVWTTFHSNQWDLNYSNPAVFNRMAGELLFLANAGIEVLRLDAVAFLWKQMGTSCENLPEAHLLIQAFNAAARIASPALIFKSEAIVHPDDVVRYIDPGECQISYNPLLMALLWDSLATRQTALMTRSMQERFKIHPNCAWVNYVRCHDDIGWTFSDEDAALLGINGYHHRRFLNEFYTGKFPGSFARGLPFQENPRTGDVRISGSCASLAGLEKAVIEETDREVELALRRILLIHSVILSIGGIPLIYLGDEIGRLNDYRYRNDPAKVRDSRWVHRPFADWQQYERRSNPDTVEGKLYTRLLNLIHLRKHTSAFAGSATDILKLRADQVFAYLRQGKDDRVLVVCNFSENLTLLDGNEIRLHGLGYVFTDLITGLRYSSKEALRLEPYQFVWLQIRE